MKHWKRILALLLSALLSLTSLSGSVSATEETEEEKQSEESVINEQISVDEESHEETDEIESSDDDSIELASEIIDSGTCGENLSWTLDSDGSLVISGSGEMYDWGGDRSPLCKHSQMYSVTIGDGVTSIGTNAFIDCKSLKDVEIPASVTSIGAGAFANCSSLTNIVIPDSVTGISNAVFGGCSSLTNIVIPDNVTSIGDNAFSGCNSLTKIEFPDSLTSIGEGAFMDCSSLTNIVVPDNVTSIGTCAFERCINLKSVKIPTGLTSIGVNPFEGCDGITLMITGSGPLPDFASAGCSFFDGITEVIISEGVTSIGDEAFSHSTSLVSITIPNSVTSIGKGAFSQCSSLISITIPEGVTSIGADTFTWCENLTSVRIPASVTSIGAGAFMGSGPDVYFAGSEKEWKQATSNGDIALSDELVHFYDGKTFSSPQYVWEENERGYSVTATAICDQDPTFQITETVEASSEITLNSTCTEDGVLQYVASFSESYFATQIKTVSIPATGHDYELDRWKWDQDHSSAIATFVCRNDQTHTESVDAHVESEEFEYGIRYTASVIGPDGLVYTDTVDNRTVGGKCGNDIQWALYNSGILVITGTGEMSDFKISGYSYNPPWYRNYNNVIKQVIISDGITSIGTYAFISCWNLREIKIPDSVKRIGNNAFEACTSLESIILPNGVESIEADAITYCYELSSIELPSSMSSIGIGNFSNCGKLKAVYYTGTQTQWGDLRNQFSAIESLSQRTTIHYDCDRMNPRDLQTAIVSDIEDQSYACSEIKPEVIVTLDDTVLIEGLDYSTVYSDNINIGTGTVTITGIGYYTGQIIKTFEIVPVVLSKTIALSATSYTYTGKANEPTVTINGLTQGVDFDVTYSNNINAGKATVTVSGIGNYSGSITKTFTIKPKAVTPSVTLSKAAYTFDGKAKNPSVTVKAGTKKLTASDYTVTYAKGRKNVGKYAVKVTLKGNYSGSKTVYFKINPKGTTLATSTAASKAITVKWKKQSAKMASTRISGYQIQVATNSKFTKNKKTVTVKGYSSTSKKVTKLKGKTKYYIRIRTYKTVSGTQYYSPWSKVKTVTTKK